MARSTRLNSQRIQMIQQAKQLGATNQIAAKYAGVPVSTFYYWMQDAQSIQDSLEEETDEAGEIEQVEAYSQLTEDQRMRLELLESVRKAEGDAAIGWLSRIEQAAANGTWSAAAWKLERLYPDGFGRYAGSHLDPDGTHAPGAKRNGTEAAEDDYVFDDEQLRETVDVLGAIGVLPGQNPEEHDANPATEGSSSDGS